MHGFEVLLALIVVAAALAPLAEKLDVPLPVVQVVGGAVLAAVPFLRDFELNPEVAFTIFVPPMLYWSALRTSPRDLKRNARSIGMLAVWLVLVTLATVAVVAHALIPGMGWAAAFVLGAVVSPPDAAVAMALAHRLGIPRRLVTVLEGETLLNDSTAFVSYNLAVAAVLTGAFSLQGAVLQFGWAVIGGVLFGLLTAALVVFLRLRIHHTEVENTISLMTPFTAFLPAEAFHASGVLAVLTTGLVLSRFAPRIVSARTRVQAAGMWGILTFVLEGLVFMLIGLNLGAITIEQLHKFEPSLLVRTLVISAVVIVTRIVWVFIGTYGWRLSRKIRENEPLPPWRRVAFVAWTGLRGGDTLVTALAIPLLTSAGTAFPFRAEITAIGMGVILVTLVLQGLTLRPLVRVLKLSEQDVVHDHEELAARRVAAQAGREVLLREAKRMGIDPDAVERLAASHVIRTRSDVAHDLQQFEEASEKIAALERLTIAAERAALLELRDTGTISEDILRKMQSELDLEELRLASTEE
jgi:CPA1 family monovalent cation:H+ antiporter